MSAFHHGFGDQLRQLAGMRRYQLMLLVFVCATVLTVATYQQSAMREMPVAVYDADGTALSRFVQRSLDATPELRVVTDAPPTLEDAQVALTRGDLCAVVVVPDGFTAAVKRGRRAEVLVAADLSNILTGKTAQRTVAKVLATVAAGAQVSLVEKLGTPPSAALARAMPITITEAFAGNPTAGYAPYTAPAAAYYFLNVLTLFLAWSVLWSPPPGRRRAETLGRMTAVLVVSVLAALFTTYGILRIDGLRPASSFPVVLLAIVALVASDLLFATAILALFRNQMFSFQATVFLGMLSLMLSGLTWPWDEIPFVLQLLSALIPFTPFGRAMRLFFPGQATLADLALPLAWMTAQVALYLAIIGVSALVGRLVAARRVRPAMGAPGGGAPGAAAGAEGSP